MATTSQNGIKQAASNMTDYSLFLGGINSKGSALEQYTPLKTGYNRIFIVKVPRFLNKLDSAMTTRFKHLVEYGFIGFDGLGNLSLETEQITGGYAGRQMDIATVTRDETSEVTLRMYEMAGSPTREFIDAWVTGITDPLTGLSHYHNVADVPFNQANHTMEVVYVATDSTGRSDNIEYACLLTNMMPKQVKKDQFNYEAGQHNIVQMDIPFTAVRYESSQVNELAKALVKKYAITKNTSYQFSSDYKVSGDNITDKAGSALPASNHDNITW